MSKAGDNVGEAENIAAQELRAFIDRVRRLEEEKQTVADDIKDVYGEAKGRGYDTKAIKAIVAMLKRDPGERAEQQSILETYMAALGMLESGRLPGTTE